jgi:hypothetical protein
LHLFRDPSTGVGNLLLWLICEDSYWKAI